MMKKLLLFVMLFSMMALFISPIGHAKVLVEKAVKNRTVAGHIDVQRYLNPSKVTIVQRYRVQYWGILGGSFGKGDVTQYVDGTYFDITNITNTSTAYTYKLTLDPTFLGTLGAEGLDANYDVDEEIDFTAAATPVSFAPADGYGLTFWLHDATIGGFGIMDDGGFGAYGTQGAGSALWLSGAGTRCIWYPRKTAFRAMTVTGTDMDDANVGIGSAAFGHDNKASGLDSFSNGYSNIASGDYSTATGFDSNATANGSHAMNSSTASAALATSTGEGTTASGNAAFSTGKATIASGAQSFTSGIQTYASGLDTYAGGANAWNKGEVSWIYGENYGLAATCLHSFLFGYISTASPPIYFTRANTALFGGTDLQVDGNETIAQIAAVGAEILTNGTFTAGSAPWGFDAVDWTYNAGTSAMDKDANGIGALSQAVLIAAALNPSSDMLLLQFTVSNWTAGTVIPSYKLWSGEPVSANGVYHYYFYSGTGGATTPTFTPSNDARFTIDNVSLKRIEGGNLKVTGNASGTPEPFFASLDSGAFVTVAPSVYLKMDTITTSANFGFPISEDVWIESIAVSGASFADPDDVVTAQIFVYDDGAAVNAACIATIAEGTPITTVQATFTPHLYQCSSLSVLTAYVTVVGNLNLNPALITNLCVTVRYCTR